MYAGLFAAEVLPEFAPEAEAREAEMVRRRLHNMVQELKGNIRVFGRVRPLLPSDVSGTNDEKARMAALANMSYPDSRDHQEIVLSSTSESATGQERKDTWNFSFDRVILHIYLVLHNGGPPY